MKNMVNKELEISKLIKKTQINSAVVIPALNPIPNLVSLVEELLREGVPHVIVVNDGSAPSNTYIFDKLECIEHCTVLTHEVNRGKGRALKTAFTFFLNNFPYLDGVVTADADGQHTVDDICDVCKKLSEKSEDLVLGMRSFKDKSVPRRSYMGNRVTSCIFRILYGSYLEDTQTGLRGIPSNELAWMTEIPGERYDYEINMLIQCKWRSIGFISVPIQTLYFDNNSGTHFNTFSDAGRIFLSLLSGFMRYTFSSLISGILDILTFFILNSFILAFLDISQRLLTSTVIARIISSCCNFSINKKLFLAKSGKSLRLAVRYYSLWLLQLVASYCLLYASCLYSAINETILKVCIDLLLGIISYQIQLRWVFNLTCIEGER